MAEDDPIGYRFAMTRNEALARLGAEAATVRATALYLYGSTGRDSATQESDLDLYIDYDPSGRFNAFDLVGIKQFLEIGLARRST